MTASLRDLKASAILLDIEGTTTPLTFVYEVLFPYARSQARSFLAHRLTSPEVQADVAGLRREHAEDSRKGLAPPELRELTAGARP